MQKFHGETALQAAHISFRYQKNVPWVLKDVNLEDRKSVV